MQGGKQLSRIHGFSMEITHPAFKAGLSRIQSRFTNAQGQWQAEGRVSWPRRLRDAQEAQIREALRAGQVQPQVSRWPGWRVALPPGEAGEPSEALGRLEVPW